MSDSKQNKSQKQEKSKATGYFFDLPGKKGGFTIPLGKIKKTKTKREWV